MSVRGRIMMKGAIVLIGAVLLAASWMGWVEDFWSGMGAGLMLAGGIQLIRLQRYRRDPQYRDKMDVEMKDERNKFLSMKAWSWAGYLFVLIAAVGTIVLKIVGKDELMMMVSGSLCLVLVLYWLCWLYLRKKY